MPIRFTFLLLFSLSSSLLSGDTIHFTFEVLKVKNNYSNVVQKKADELKEKDFDCHIIQSHEELSLRCNEITNIQDLVPTISKFKKEKIPYTLIHLDDTPNKQIRNRQIPLYVGYHAYEQKNYDKALEIFDANYRVKKSPENAEAYALVLLKKGDYPKAITILSPYGNTQPKIKKLYQESIIGYIDILVKNDNYKAAKNLIHQAKINTEQKAKLYDKLTNMYAIKLNKEKRYRQALTILEPYQDESNEVKKLSQQILYSLYLEDGWKNLDKNPMKALESFKKSCKIKNSNTCSEGKMYSYDRLNNTDKAILSAKELYTEQKKDKYLKVIILNYIKKGNSKDATYYYSLLKNKKGVPNLQVSQLTALATNYIRAGKLTKAKNIIKRIEDKKIKKNIYHQLTQAEQNNAMNKLLNYNKQKEYYKCYTYAKKLNQIYTDINIDRIGGWCAYHNGKYNIAKDFFEKAIKKDDKKEIRDIYALALSSHKANNDDRANAILKEMTDYFNYTEQISLLYNDMEEYGKAKAVLVKNDGISKYASQIRAINKSMKYETPISQIAGGLSYYHNKGTEGKAYLEVTSLPINIDYLFTNGDYMYGNFNFLHLSNGLLTSNNYKTYGFGKITNPYHITQIDSIEGVIGFKNKLFQAEIGFTPIGLNLSPQITGELYSHYLWKQWDIHAAIEQKGIKESFLSYVGQSTELNDKKYNWGRVLKRGTSAGISYDGDTTYTFDLFYYPKIYGENIIENSETKAVATAIYHTATVQYAFLDFGAVIAYDSFERNSNLFTYGHGGYFSPQKFWLGSMIIDIADYIDENTYYRFQGALGYEKYTVDNTERFPLTSNSLSSSIENGYSESGLTIKTSLQGGYKINKHFTLSAGVSWEKMYGYNLLQTGVAISYHFKSIPKTSLKRLRDAYKINQLIP